MFGSRNTSTSEDTTTAAGLAAVSLKLPPFWSTDAELWFTQVESQFALRGITQDETRYHYVVSSLDHETSKRCKEILRAPPASGKYEAIKRSLLKNFSTTEYERATRILHMPELGDTSPMKLLDEMMDLLGDYSPCFLFRTAFLEKLPVVIRTQLLGLQIEDVRELGRMAQSMWVANSAVCSTEQNAEEVSAVKKQKLKKPNMTLCRYHNAFGAAAAKCVEPCKWKNKAGNGSADQM